MSVAAAQATAPRQLFVRHARKQGRSVAILRAYEHGTTCVVQTQVFPVSGDPLSPGPYAFPSAREATAFVTEAVEALMYLGCDVQAE